MNQDKISRGLWFLFIVGFLLFITAMVLLVERIKFYEEYGGAYKIENEIYYPVNESYNFFQNSFWQYHMGAMVPYNRPLWRGIILIGGLAFIAWFIISEIKRSKKNG
jgi:hypothetical protein